MRPLAAGSYQTAAMIKCEGEKKKSHTFNTSCLLNIFAIHIRDVLRMKAAGKCSGHFLTFLFILFFLERGIKKFDVRWTFVDFFFSQDSLILSISVLIPSKEVERRVMKCFTFVFHLY